MADIVERAVGEFFIRLLGTILAGGQSRRFGSDKAQFRIDGKRLIDLVAMRLAAQTDALVVCGRLDDAFICLTDQPDSGLGPLGGLNAALRHAAANGFGGVVSAGCDVLGLPDDAAARLSGDGPAIAAGQPVVSFWPTELAENLETFLARGGRALYGFADEVSARRVYFDPPLINVNRPADLPRNTHGTPSE
ncbi:molybdenum cofactor guanylyltransferase [Altererythrobacter sp.]|nr:molybdenum cofactor guanylyltransferase [Altererythrobacter sp.]